MTPEGTAYLIDCIKLWRLVGTELREFFSDPTKVFIVFAGEGDLTLLNQMFKIRFRGVVDVALIYKVTRNLRNKLGYPKVMRKILGKCYNNYK